MAAGVRGHYEPPMPPLSDSFGSQRSTFGKRSPLKSMHTKKNPDRQTAPLGDQSICRIPNGSVPSPIPWSDLCHDSGPLNDSQPSSGSSLPCSDVQFSILPFRAINRCLHFAEAKAVWKSVIRNVGETDCHDRFANRSRNDGEALRTMAAVVCGHYGKRLQCVCRFRYAVL